MPYLGPVFAISCCCMISGKINNQLNGAGSFCEEYLRLKGEIAVLEWRLLDLCHLKVLYEAILDLSDVHVIEVDYALAYLGKRSAIKWPIEQFRGAFYGDVDQGRSKNLAFALGEIRFALEISPYPTEDFINDPPRRTLH
jgi:hypothetical protein